MKLSDPYTGAQPLPVRVVAVGDGDPDRTQKLSRTVARDLRHINLSTAQMQAAARRYARHRRRLWVGFCAGMVVFGLCVGVALAAGGFSWTLGGVS